MVLPFLPAAEINPMFQQLQRQAYSPALINLTNYVYNTWINSTLWSPANWTVFKQAVRTNNDVEGWHHGLNRRASGRGQLPLYLLIKLRRIQRRKYRDLQARIFALWEEYDAQEKSAKQLLKACSYLNGPV